MAEPEPMVIKVTTNDVFSVDQAAKELGVHRATIYRWVKSGVIVSFVLGESFYIPKTEVPRLKAHPPIPQKKVRVAQGLVN